MQTITFTTKSPATGSSYTCSVRLPENAEDLKQLGWNWKHVLASMNGSSVRVQIQAVIRTALNAKKTKDEITKLVRAFVPSDGSTRSMTPGQKVERDIDKLSAQERADILERLLAENEKKNGGKKKKA